jgi:hypothetical protein
MAVVRGEGRGRGGRKGGEAKYVVMGSQVRLPTAYDEMFNGPRVSLICSPPHCFLFLSSTKCLHVSAEISKIRNYHIPVFTGGKVLPYQLKVPNSHTTTVRIHFVKSLFHMPTKSSTFWKFKKKMKCLCLVLFNTNTEIAKTQTTMNIKVQRVGLTFKRRSADCFI